MRVTIEEAKRIISNRGHHQFPERDRDAALDAAAELKREGHAIVTDEVRDHDGNLDRLSVGHYLTCLKCVGAR